MMEVMLMAVLRRENGCVCTPNVLPASTYQQCYHRQLRGDILPKTAQPSKPAPYHHGDLRRALLGAAGRILSETGRWDFSLREVARRAEVSHAASYRHFADKEALIAAIAVAGYERLHACMASATMASLDPVERLRLIGQAYIGFGIANPALYRLMFGQALPSIGGLPSSVMDVLHAARAVLREVVVDGARAGIFMLDPEDAQDVSIAVVTAWSLVHGFTLLTIDRALDREMDPKMVDALAARVTERLITGLGRKEVVTVRKRYRECGDV